MERVVTACDYGHPLQRLYDDDDKPLEQRNGFTVCSICKRTPLGVFIEAADSDGGECD